MNQILPIPSENIIKKTHPTLKLKKKYTIIPNDLRVNFINRVASKKVTIKQVYYLLVNIYNFIKGSSRIWFKNFNF